MFFISSIVLHSLLMKLDTYALAKILTLVTNYCIISHP